MPNSATVARKLAAAMLGGTWQVPDLVERGSQALADRHAWMRPLAKRIGCAFAGSSRPTIALLARYIEQCAEFQQAWSRQAETGEPLELSTGLLLPPVMSPAAAGPETWELPRLPTPGALAEWLGLGIGELDWFADVGGRERRLPADRLRHYRYRWVPKRSGGARLIETPKARLKGLQRRILQEILDRIPAHDAAHGFRRGRWIGSFVEPHVCRRVVMRIDLRDFFTSICRARIVGLFLTAGYPEPVARLMAGLCTNSVPPESAEPEAKRGGAESTRLARRFLEPHLPQGAPTSPALANLCAYRLDSRLRALAGCQAADYTRYADDLVFSGDGEFGRSVRRFSAHVAAIALDEGFEVQHRKTRIMRAAVRQQVAGVVINRRTNIRRADYDELKAILFNCRRGDPASQNREGVEDFRAHLLGRIEHIRGLHAPRGERLRALFDGIRWPR